VIVVTVSQGRLPRAALKLIKRDQPIPDKFLKIGSGNGTNRYIITESSTTKEEEVIVEED
jgi:hypothetical protein